MTRFLRLEIYSWLTVREVFFKASVLSKKERLLVKDSMIISDKKGKLNADKLAKTSKEYRRYMAEFCQQGFTVGMTKENGVACFRDMLESNLIPEELITNRMISLVFHSSLASSNKALHDLFLEKISCARFDSIRIDRYSEYHWTKGLLNMMVKASHLEVKDATFEPIKDEQAFELFEGIE